MKMGEPIKPIPIADCLMAVFDALTEEEQDEVLKEINELNQKKDK